MQVRTFQSKKFFWDTLMSIHGTLVLVWFLVYLKSWCWLLMLWPLPVTPEVTHVGVYHRPSDSHFSSEEFTQTFHIAGVYVLGGVASPSYFVICILYSVLQILGGARGGGWGVGSPMRGHECHHRLTFSRTRLCCSRERWREMLTKQVCRFRTIYIFE